MERLTVSIENKEPHSGRIQDDFGNTRNISERITGAIKTIISDHAAIHKSEGYSISGIFAGVANGATVNYAFKTPTVASGKIIHLKLKEFYTAGTKLRTDLYEAPTNAPINGTDITAHNHNRASAPIHTTDMQAIKTAMDINLAGAANLETMLTGFQSSVRSMDVERMLKADTWYIRTLTNGTGGAADINFFEFWYEEDNI